MRPNRPNRSAAPAPARSWARILALTFGLAAAFGQPAIAQAQPYKLSDAELAYDCKKLTSKLTLRILQIRNQPSQAKSSTIARTVQQAATPVFGGTTFGGSPEAQYAADRSFVEAFNQRLVERNCASFDLDVALKPSAATDTPRPTIPPKNAGAKAKAPGVPLGGPAASANK